MAKKIEAFPSWVRGFALNYKAPFNQLFSALSSIHENELFLLNEIPARPGKRGYEEGGRMNGPG